MRLHRGISLNAPIQRNDKSNLEMIDLIGKDDDYSHLFIREFFSLLSHQDLKVLEYLFDGKSQREIGIKLGYSQVHAGRIIKKIREQAREYFGRGIA